MTAIPSLLMPQVDSTEPIAFIGKRQRKRTQRGASSAKLFDMSQLFLRNWQAKLTLAVAFPSIAPEAQLFEVNFGFQTPSIEKMLNGFLCNKEVVC